MFYSTGVATFQYATRARICQGTFQIVSKKVLWSERGSHQTISIPFSRMSRASMAGAASQAGDADSSRAPGFTSGLQGSVNVHRGALLLMPQ